MSRPLLLTLAGVNAYYGKLHVLKGVSLHVNEGELVALLGANGAGKSTTLRAICGLVKATAAKLEFEGVSLLQKTPEEIVRLGLVQVPEGRQIFGELSVQDNLLLGAYTQFKAGRKQQVKEDLERLYERFPMLRELRNRRGGSLSGGQQQLLALGRALMARPKLLLLDEPCLGLAPLMVKEVMSIVAELNKQGTTLLLVEQNARAALEIAHRGYVMETGEVVLEGTAEELLRNRDVRRAYLGKDYQEV